ncbi:class I SAM-dependent methyltransferase [Desulfogranum japonicum]|uniref:class I SAM-dependent methyltransferase n=1 Tax=Desulfogranum japonicum TaxID=231447 RepID=UPI0004035322|nr:histidine kinase [Desulfogranum japonicum]
MTGVRLRYQTLEFGETDIHLCTLRDRQQFHDPAGIADKVGISSALWPIFGVIWPSGLVLAHFINNYDFGSKRILEVGCGIALSSLLLNKKHADITATDYHPEVEKFLQRNTLLNEGEYIAFERVGWSDKNDQLGLFDLIIGSDLLYEDCHVELLSYFIEKHSKPACEVIIVDPGRGRKNKLCSIMKKMGYYYSCHKANNTSGYLKEKFKGHILKFIR